jgi:hypothetical protein
MSSGGQGWGQAPPFAAIPAGNDHPLAASPPPPARSAPSSSDHPLAPPLPPPPPTASSSSHSASRSIAAAPMSAPPPSSQNIARSNSSSMTLEALADELLSRPSYRTEQLGLDPILRPKPLPANEQGLDRLRTLVERRAWGDVLKMATTLLTSGSSQYSGVYASLLVASALPDISGVSLEVKRETVEIMILQCHAWLKLRRYVELVTEVERWNFWMQNDATAQSPDWLPWSMYVNNDM